MDYVEHCGLLKAADGLQLFWKAWTVPHPAGIVIIAHGVGEHCGRYCHLTASLANKNISVYALDHRGHGRSEGRRGHVMRFTEYTEDLKLLFDRVKIENPVLPVILLGHSMGGVIAFKYVLTYPGDVHALVLSSAGLIPAVPIPLWKKTTAIALSRWAPAFTMSTGLDVNLLSHDQSIIQACLNDPLVHDRASGRWYTEFTKAGQDCLKHAEELILPLLIIHGREDRIVDCRGSEEVMERASSSDKTLYIFDGLKHETMNEQEPDRARVLGIVSRWIMEHRKSLR
jgi:alpha-beta hydrolase superfamily lysophospholipase